MINVTNVNLCNYSMETLIPANGICLPRMASGERRLSAARQEGHAWGDT